MKTTGALSVYRQIPDVHHPDFHPARRTPWLCSTFDSTHPDFQKTDVIVYIE
jgi:hypothetical protein